MTTEEITLHGGPKHGETFVIPGGRDILETVEYFGALGSRTFRNGSYTRVYHGGRHTSQFEWAGYRGPARPTE